MKVIRTSNHDDEGPNGTERLIQDNLTEAEANRLVDLMNNDPRRSDRDWFRSVPDDYQLRVFQP